MVRELPAVLDMDKGLLRDPGNEGVALWPLEYSSIPTGGTENLKKRIGGYSFPNLNG